MNTHLTKLWLGVGLLMAQSALAADPYFVDLSTVMRLAGAEHDEVEFARVQHVRAVAESKQAWQRFWPAVSLVTGYRAHEGNVQDIEGAVFDARKQQYTLGAAVLIDWSPGDLYFGALAVKQQALAVERQIEVTRRETVLKAVTGYFDLLASEAEMAVREDDLRVLTVYAKQLEGAVTAGTAFRADWLRVKTQVSRSKLEIRQGEERRDLRAAGLAEALRLPADTRLRPAKADLVPVALVKLGDAGGMVAEALEKRSELSALDATAQAAAIEERRSRVAPMVPNVQAGYLGGGLGGGFAGEWGNFRDTQDIFVGLGWKIGPGGLFDRQRRRVAESRVAETALLDARLKAAIGREVVEATARVRSAKAQIALADEAVETADEMVQVAKERQASQLGVVLEYLLAREEANSAKRQRIEAVAAFNQAQHLLLRVLER